MIITRLGSVPSLGDTLDTDGNAIATSDKIFCFFRADGAIALGAPVELQVDTNNNSTGNVEGIEIVEADLNNPGGGSGSILGGYRGVNLTNPSGTKVNVNLADADGGVAAGGAVTLRGVVAAAGDWVQIQTYGAGHVLGEGSTDIVAGDGLVTDATGGRCITSTDLADGSGKLIEALGPLTAAAEGLIPCFFRCM